MISLGIFAALVTVALWSLAQIIGKVTAPRIGNIRVAFLVLLTGIIPMIVFFAESPSLISESAAVFAILSGVATATGFVLYYKSIESQQVSSAITTVLLQQALIALYGFMILSEPIDPVQVAGTLIIFIGVFLVLVTKELKINRALIPAILANVAWAVYWILLTTSISSSNQVVTPLLISRIASIATIAVLFFLFFARSSYKPPARLKHLTLAVILILVAIEGLADGSGNLIFGVVVNQNLLGIGAVLVTLEPALVIIVAYFIFKERLTKVQMSGIVLATIGALALALF